MCVRPLYSQKNCKSNERSERRRSLSKRPITIKREKTSTADSTDHCPSSQRASVIWCSSAGRRSFSECGPSTYWCSPIGAHFALYPLAVVSRTPCRIALQRTPAQGTPLALRRPPAPRPRLAAECLFAYAIATHSRVVRRVFGAQSERVTERYHGKNEGVGTNQKGPRCSMAAARGASRAKQRAARVPQQQLH